MIDAQDLTNLVMILTGIFTGGMAPLIVFFARLWQQQKSTEERLGSSIEIRKTIQEDIRHQQEIFNPQFQKALTDIALIAQSIDVLVSRLEKIETRLFDGEPQWKGWHPIHEREKDNK